MRRIAINALKPGMIIARSVHSQDGRVLLSANCLLTDVYIGRLSKLDIGSVYIKDGFDDLEVPEIVSRQVLSSISKSLGNSFKAFSERKALNINSIKSSITLLVKDVVDNRNVLFQLDEIRTHSDYLFYHSINVATFALMTGVSLGYGEGDLVEMGLGAILHDSGMIAVDSAILNKTESLSLEEQKLVQHHCEVGFNMLRANREFSVKSAHIAFQHHERLDGSGYPRHLEGKNILEYAKVVAVADIFDALVSDRPHRPALSSVEALGILRKLAPDKLDPEIVEAFATNVAVYPVGTLVQLNTGHIALVTAVDKTRAAHPLINVICDNTGNLIHPFYKIDLRQTVEVCILKRLNNEESEAIRLKIIPGENRASGAD